MRFRTTPLPYTTALVFGVLISAGCGERGKTHAVKEDPGRETQLCASQVSVRQHGVLGGAVCSNGDPRAVHVLASEHLSEEVAASRVEVWSASRLALTDQEESLRRALVYPLPLLRCRDALRRVRAADVVLICDWHDIEVCRHAAAVALDRVWEESADEHLQGFALALECVRDGFLNCRSRQLGLETTVDDLVKEIDAVSTWPRATFAASFTPLLRRAERLRARLFGMGDFRGSGVDDACIRISCNG